MKDKMSVVLRQIAPNRKQEVNFGRFLRNPKVDVCALKSVLMDKDEQLNVVCANRHILLVQDTSELSFGLAAAKTGLGKVGNGNECGFFLHPVVALDASDGGCLGLGEVEVYKRTTYEASDPMSDSKYRAKALQKRAFETKESYRWYSSIAAAVKRTPDAARQTVVADRESDIYEALCGFHRLGCDFAIRARHLGRTLNADRSGHLLDKELSEWASEGSYCLALPATDKRSAHTAQLDIKFGAVVLARPHVGLVQDLPKTLPIYVVEVKERPETVVNDEAPIHWVILTSHAVDSVETALQIIRFYRWRWVIEQLFRTLKAEGLNIEQSEVTTYDGLANLAVLALLTAVQIMQLVQARDGTTQQPIESVFTPSEIAVLIKINPTLEGKTDKLKNPYPPQSLAFAAWIIARLAGWSGYKSQRPAGPITMHLGFSRFKAIVEGFYLRI
jgi:hypothetical protein